MEQTTLQQRIDERAKKRLLQDLRDATDKEQAVQNLLGRDLYTPKLEVKNHYNYDSKPEIVMYNDFSRKVFDALLPKYIAIVTDEILKKIDEIDFFTSNKDYTDS